jgi:hypothetical protein
MPEVFRATEPFSFTSHTGVPRVVRAGDLMADDDPDFKGRAHLFEPAVNAANRASETASAAPGERRHRPKPRPENTAAQTEKQPTTTEQPEPPAGDKS